MTVGRPKYGPCCHTLYADGRLTHCLKFVVRIHCFCVKMRESVRRRMQTETKMAAGRPVYMDRVVTLYMPMGSQ